MSNDTTFVGLDVHKSSISIASIAPNGETRNHGKIAFDLGRLRKVLDKMGAASTLKVCYEAGPGGYVVHRFLVSIGIHCDVIAPSLIPTRAGDKVKTDKKDACNLAKLHRAGQLVPIYVRSVEDEGFRDLVRQRDDFKKHEKLCKQTLVAFLNRNSVVPPSGVKTHWTTKYYTWLKTIKFEVFTKQLVLSQYLSFLYSAREAVKACDNAIVEAVEMSPHRDAIHALTALCGIKILSAAGIVAEIVTARRFEGPKQLMSYAGLGVSEYSSGRSVTRGGITKSGDSHLRRIVVESAHSYTRGSTPSTYLKKRMRSQGNEVEAIAMKAYTRLTTRYRRLAQRGLNKNKAIVAVARELLGFIWDIARTVEARTDNCAAA